MDFPELNKLAWNRDRARPISREEAFALYERNWRHAAVDQLSSEEAALIDSLTLEFGRGHRLFG